MSRFFQRIFVSVWVIMIATVTLTIYFGSSLPGPDDQSQQYDSQMVKIIADDLRDALSTDNPDAVMKTINRHVLDFENLMQIYVLDPNGNEVLERRLPFAVSRSKRTPRFSFIDRPEIFDDPRITIHEEGLQGYKVVGFRSGYPLGRVLVRPGARLLLFALAMIVSCIISFILARFIVLPVRRLRVAGQQVAKGDLSVRVAPTVGGRQDDIALLAHDFDAMTERIDTLLSAQRRLMRDVSHELRSPLARLQALQSLARQKEAAKDGSIIDRMDAESERLNQLIEEVLTFARIDAKETLNTQTTDLADLVETILEDARVEIGDEDKQVNYDGPERLTLELDSALIHSAIENIVRNALRYTDDGTSVSVSLAKSDDRVTLNVKDQGPGVPEDSLNKLFDPFYQVDASRSQETTGSGVGLAIAKRAVVLHRGTIQATNVAPTGLSVKIMLPVSTSK